MLAAIGAVLGDRLTEMEHRMAMGAAQKQSVPKEACQHQSQAHHHSGNPIELTAYQPDENTHTPKDPPDHTVGGDGQLLPFLHHKTRSFP